MKQYWIIYLLIIFPWIQASAQTTTAWPGYSPVYSQYMFHGLAINPAYTGSAEALSATITHRTQWMGFDGAPESQTISAQAPLKKQHISAGLLLFTEKYGIQRNTSFNTYYTYSVKFGQSSLSFGLKAGLDVMQANWSDISTTTPDQVFQQGASRYILPNFGTGVFFYNKLYYVGLSVPSLLSYKRDENNSYKPYQDFSNNNYLFTSGITLVSNEVKFKPSVLLKYYQNQLQYDINVNVGFLRDLLEVGASYRNKEELIALFAIKPLDQLTFGLSYDYSLGALNKFNNGSYEIMLRYDFIYKQNATNPRFF
jgi:type IX secretion system PorP/SprF family membrane protein